MRQYAVDVILDPKTAHPELNLSDDGKRVRARASKKNLPNNAERYDTYTSVMGKEGFSSGRFYFEVQVKGKTHWTVGVVNEFVGRKGFCARDSSAGSWLLDFSDDRKYETCTDPRVCLSLQLKTQKVGVFVDYEEGLVSFYNVESRSHIYSFTAQTFTEKLYPLLDPWPVTYDKSSATMVILPVLDHLSYTEDLLHLVKSYSSKFSPPRTRNWPEISMNTGASVETLRRALSQLQQTLDRNVCQMLRRMQQYAVDLTLDPKTAHSELILSDGGKQVRAGACNENLPDNPERFDSHTSVLGREGFSSGSFYFEVQVKGKTHWTVGVARESVARKGCFTRSSSNGFWAVDLNGTDYSALADPPVRLSLRVKPQKVGVFVDYEEGLVSFYDVESRSHIYSFTGQTFTEKLYPLLDPWHHDKTSATMVILPVY